MIDILLVIIGLYILIKGADLFVDGVSSLAKNLKVAKIIISLTVVAFGTSVPELSISLQSMVNGNNDMVLANVIGSTVVNILLIIGIVPFVKEFKINKENKRKMLIHLLCVIIFSILFLINNDINPIEAFILVLVFISFIIYVYKFAKQTSNETKLVQKEIPRWNIKKSILFSIIGLVLVFLGSNLAVDSTTSLAYDLNINEKLITMLLLVFGTSLPELVISISSVKKEEFDILLGNIVGTNIFNIGFVLAIPILIYGPISSLNFNIIDSIVMIIACLILYFFSVTNKKITKKEGFIMLLILVIYYVYLYFI